jgi:cyclase
VKRMLRVAALAALPCSLALAQPQIDYSKLDIKTTDLGHGVYFLGWQGGDSLILVGDEGVLLVDTAVAQLGDKIKAAIARVSDKPIRLIVNTHAHADHFGANESLAKGGALIVGHEKLRERMAKGQYLAAFRQTIPPSPPAALPAIVYADTMTIHFDGETVQLVHSPRAHASGTFGGDRSYPFFDMSSGGSLAGTIAAEEKMLSLSDDKTRVVADEGDPGSREGLKASHDMLVTLQARVQKLIDEGKSEDQVVADKPTKDLDARWARQGSPLNGDFYTRLVYQSLKPVRPPTKP